MTDSVGMPKRNVRGMIGAQTGATNRNATCEIEHLAHYHVFVRVVSPHPIGRVNRFVVKTLQIDRVWAANSDSAIVDVPRHGSDQPKILIFVITGTRRGEKNKRQPALIAENKHFKLAAQIWRVPFDVTFVHIDSGDRMNKIKPNVQLPSLILIIL